MPSTVKKERPSSPLQPGWRASTTIEIGGVAVEHEALGAVELVAAPDGVAVMATLAASFRPLSSEKARVAVTSPAAMPRQQRLLLLLRAGVQDRGGGQRRGREEGRAQEAAAHFLQHDAELAIAEAAAAIGLGNVHGGEAHFLVELLPALALEARSVAIRRRTSLVGDRASSARRRLARNSSCSAEKLKRMATPPASLEAILLRLFSPL